MTVNGVESAAIERPHKRHAVLSANTLIPVGVLSVLLLVPVSGYIWLDSKFDEVREEEDLHFKELTKRVDLMEANFATQNRTLLDRWTLSNQTIWYLELKQLNPNLSLPDPRKTAKAETSP